MKFLIVFLIVAMSEPLKAQTSLDLSLKKGSEQTISIKESAIRLINCSKKFRYKVEWGIVQNLTPVFVHLGGEMSAATCNDEVELIIEKLTNGESEDTIRKYVDMGNKLMPILTDSKCIAGLKTSIFETENQIPIPYIPLKNNQIITVIVTKVEKDTGEPVKDAQWTFVLKTPEKTRWLVHYGLTYSPNLLSKTNHYYASADTSVANRFTVTKENKNGPRPWENISATINFTYPFHAEPKDVDLGFTAGFGLSAGLELSGQTGLSMIIGDNIILGTGVVMMQKYQLMGKYKEGQVVKENLDFNGLHEKVWLPGLYFTLGFRFGNNPFAKKASEQAATPDEPAPTSE
jgi:hypothetical protein